MNSSTEGGQTNAEQPRTRTKWAVDMNTALIDTRKQAEFLHQSAQCPRKENGNKIGIMKLVLKIWNEKGYAYMY